MRRTEGAVSGEECPDEFGAGVHVVGEALYEFEQAAAAHHRISARILIRFEY